MNIDATLKCTRCGVSVPPDAPDGLCPRCVMAMCMMTGTASFQDAAPVQPPLPPEQIAPHFPQLDILACLGRGGMGVVYKARQKSLGRLVALKVLAPERVRDSRFAERFTREAHALAALNHPHIVTVHDFGVVYGSDDAPLYYLLMEFVDGANLRQLLRAQTFSAEEALAIVPPICEALQYAHEHGIVHRDIKPENLLLDKGGRVKIADFGIAKMLSADGSDLGLAETQPLGTPQYMAPEQTAHRTTDHRADIYSLGVVLYEMLTGELPGKPLEAPSKKVLVEVRLDEIVLRALEQDPERRYQTAGELRTEAQTVAQTSAGPRGSMAAPVRTALQDYRRAALKTLGLGASWALCMVLILPKVREMVADFDATRGQAVLDIARVALTFFDPGIWQALFLSCIGMALAEWLLPAWRRHRGKCLAVVTSVFNALALASLLSLILLIAVLAGASPPQEATATFRTRVFEEDAAVVNQWIPVNQRAPGMQPGLTPFMQGMQYGPNISSVNGVTVVKRGAVITDSSLAIVGRSTVERLVSAIAARPGMLEDKGVNVSTAWWRPGLADVWSYTYSDLPSLNGALSGSGGADGFLGYRRRNGHDEIRIEELIQHSMDLPLKEGAETNSQILYEGPVPQNQDLVFLVPFVRSDDSAHYLVIDYQIGTPQDPLPRPVAWTPPPEPATPVPAPILQAPSVTRTPVLRFLVWQDENHDGFGARTIAWRPDGSQASSAEERALLLTLDPLRIDLSNTDHGKAVRIVDFCFTDPGIDSHSLGKLTISDTGGTILPAFPNSMVTEYVRSDYGTEGSRPFLVCSYALPPGVQAPAVVNVRLDYTDGNWNYRSGISIPPDGSEVADVEAGQVSQVGETPTGHAFIDLTYSRGRRQGIQYGFGARTLDGNIVGPARGALSADKDVNPDIFEFGLPLSHVKEFLFRSRKIHMVEFMGVHLQHSAALLTRTFTHTDK